jgi:hypothetical protein
MGMRHLYWIFTGLSFAVQRYGYEFDSSDTMQKFLHLISYLLPEFASLCDWCSPFLPTTFSLGIARHLHTWLLYCMSESTFLRTQGLTDFLDPRV